jgi:hypothetical protein
MAQRSIEILIGRLIADEAFREEFLANRPSALDRFRDSGHELTAVEKAAVLSTPSELWGQVAERLDPRLQKVNLTKA